MTKDEFIQRAIAKHGEGTFDYSLVPDMVRYAEKVAIICKEHGEFVQGVGKHYEGSGCPKCYNERRGQSLRFTVEDFINKAKDKHGDFYDYSQVEYYNNRSHVKIICPKHGLFVQHAGDHLWGAGCPTCGLSKRTGSPSKITQGMFVARSKSVHGDRYDYSLSEYSGVRSNVEIICKKHGAFTQSPTNHYAGKGCPRCATVISTEHQTIIDWLNEAGIEHLVNDREFIAPQELDIYIPQHNLAIEINGEWSHTNRPQRYHYDKHKLCAERGVKLLHFWAYTSVKNKPAIVKSMIYNQLGLSKRIYARKCKVVEVDSSTYKSFVEENHLEGYNSASVRLGLTYEGELLSLVGFARKGSGWELVRFATKIGYSVVGGFSKLMSKRPAGDVITYSHNDYSEGKVYENYGFKLKNVNTHTLFYLHKGKLKNRHHFMRYKILQQLGLHDDPRTESELAAELGAYRVYGSGTRTWTLPSKS